MSQLIVDATVAKPRMMMSLTGHDLRSLMLLIIVFGYLPHFLLKQLCSGSGIHLICIIPANRLDGVLS